MWLKSLFLSTHLLVSLVFGYFVVVSLTPANAVFGLLALMALLPFLVFMLLLFLFPTKVVSRLLPLTLFVPVISIVVSVGYYTFYATASLPHMLISLYALVANILYVYWYSRFGRSPNNLYFQVGKPLPDFELYTLAGDMFASSNMRSSPSILLFYRGNWCPICTSQIHDMAKAYRTLQAQGIQVFLISSQPVQKTMSLSQSVNAPMNFLVDKHNAVAKRFGLAAKGGTPAGLQLLGYDNDTVMPTAIMTDIHGTVFFADMTDNYRIRPEPSMFLAAYHEQQAQNQEQHQHQHKKSMENCTLNCCN